MVGCGCVAETRKNVLFLRRKTYGGLFFVPAGTQIGVKLLLRGRKACCKSEDGSASLILKLGTTNFPRTPPTKSFHPVALIAILDNLAHANPFGPTSQLGLDGSEGSPTGSALRLRGQLRWR